MSSNITSTLIHAGENAAHKLCDAGYQCSNAASIQPPARPHCLAAVHELHGLCLQSDACNTGPCWRWCGHVLPLTPTDQCRTGAGEARVGAGRKESVERCGMAQSVLCPFQLQIEDTSTGGRLRLSFSHSSLALALALSLAHTRMRVVPGQRCQHEASN